MVFHHVYLVNPYMYKHHKNFLITMDKKVENLIVVTIIIQETRVIIRITGKYLVGMVNHVQARHDITSKQVHGGWVSKRY